MKKVILTAILIFFFSLGHGSTLLHRAAYDGNIRKVYYILKKGADIEKKDSKGRTALFHAIFQSSVYRQRQKYRIVSYLIRKGADVNAADYEKRTPLHEALRYGNSPIALLLMKKGARVKVSDNMGATPLHDAARNGMTGIVSRLAARGADVNRGDKSGWTPLHEASARKKHRVLKLLIDRGADPEMVTEDGNTPLHLASVENNIYSVMFLLGATTRTVNRKNIFGKTPLFYAVREGSHAIVSLLLDRGARINETDSSGFTPLFYTVRTGNMKMARLLLKRGAELKTQNRSGETPLHYAARMGSEKMIELFVGEGAPRDIKNSEGKTYRDVLFASSDIFQDHRCRKRLPRLYESYMEGKHSATSYSPRRRYRHSADKCFDNNINTCWIEGRRGKGIGEKIAFYTDREIRYISILPGHGNRRLFKMHNRLQRAKISVYENSYRLYCKYKLGKVLGTLEASFEDRPVKKKFPVKLAGTSSKGYIIVIEIQSVYRGTRYKNDTCIAEVETL